MVQDDPGIEKYINRAVRRVLRTKFILGLFDNPYVNLETVSQNVRSKTAFDLAKEADLESIILLKNENETLPLNLGKKAKSGFARSFSKRANSGKL